MSIPLLTNVDIFWMVYYVNRKACDGIMQFVKIFKAIRDFIFLNVFPFLFFLWSEFSFLFLYPISNFLEMFFIFSYFLPELFH